MPASHQAVTTLPNRVEGWVITTVETTGKGAYEA